MALNLQIQIPNYNSGQFERGMNQTVANIKQSRLESEAKELAFLRDIDIDPVALMSSKSQEDQMKKIQEFNDKWTDTYKESKGKLSLEQKMGIQGEKKQLQAYQQNRLQDDNSWNRAFQIISDPRKGASFDQADFELATAEYKKSGKLPPGGFLQPKAVRAYDVREQISAGLRQKGKQGVLTEKGRLTEEYNVYGISVEQASTLETATEAQNDLVASEVANLVASNPGVERGAKELFVSLDAPTQAMYHQQADVNNDGIYDDLEKQNAVVMAYQAAVLDGGSLAISKDPSLRAPRIRSQKSKAKGTLGNPIGVADRELTFGETQYSDFFDLAAEVPATKLRKKKSNIGDITIIAGYSKGARGKINKSTDFNIVGVDRTKGEIIIEFNSKEAKIEGTKDSRGQDVYIEQGDNASIPLEGNENLLKDMHFQVGGKSLKIGELRHPSGVVFRHGKKKY